MKNKKLLVSAIAVLFSVSAVQATNITGVAGNNGVYDINPEKVNGSVGYRHYDNFNLSEGDVANLIYTGVKNGEARNVETFVNMVNNRINVNGIVNSMRDGAFYNGHAVFISPNGMVVGASGVLNVGALSVMTPSTDKYNKLLNEYGNQQYANISNLSALKKDSRNADVTINGKIIAKDGVTIDGSRINVPGTILNGVNSNEVLTNAQQADQLFNALVNTQGIAPQATVVTANNGAILLRSGNTEESGIFVSGKVENRSTGETALTNHGELGMEVTGSVTDLNNKVTLYSTKGEMNVNGAVTAANNAVAISNKADSDLNIGSKAVIVGKSVDVVTGEGAGHLAVAGAVKANDGALNIVNRGEGGLLLTSSADVKGTSVRLVNKAGDFGSAAGSKIAADKKVEIVNQGENATLNGAIDAPEGDVFINNKTGKLHLASDTELLAKNLSIKNYGEDGMTLEGLIVNEGDTAIHNYAGEMMLNGEILADGNMAVKNHADADRLFVTKNANIEHTGETLMIKNEGEDGMVLNGNVENEGNLYVYNEAGQLMIGANANPDVITTIANKNGQVFINSRKDSEGVTATSQSIISNEGGNSLAIKHQGSDFGDRGVNLQGVILNDGETAISNNASDMYVSGLVYSEGSLGIVNRAGADNMTIASDANIVAKDNANIRQAGNGDATVNGYINHEGRLNVIADQGKLNVGGTIDNTGKQLTYIASRKDGKGINVTTGFKANSNGDILIKNISGEEGVRFEGTVVNNGGQTAIVNKKGNTVVGGSIDNTGSAHDVIVSHSGDQLTARGFIKNDGAVKFVNRSGKVIDKKDLKVDSVEFQYFGQY